jgi:hypothetical protein
MCAKRSGSRKNRLRSKIGSTISPVLAGGDVLERNDGLAGKTFFSDRCALHEMI